MAYDNELSGVLFRNDKKGNDKAPDYKGQAQVEGVEYDLSSWINESQKSGEKYMKLRFEPKGARPAQTQDVPIDNSDFGTAAPDADDIPF